MKGKIVVGALTTVAFILLATPKERTLAQQGSTQSNKEMTRGAIMHVTNEELKLETKKPDASVIIAAAEANASGPTDIGVVIPPGTGLYHYRLYAKLGSDNGGFAWQLCADTPAPNSPMRCPNLNVGFADLKWFGTSGGSGGTVIQVRIVPDNPGTWRGRIEADYGR